MSLETQSTSGAEDESVASRPASGAASEDGQVILLKVSKVSATLFRNDFIDTSSAIGVTLCIKIGTHKFGLKRCRFSRRSISFLLLNTGILLILQSLIRKPGQFQRKFGNGYQPAGL